MSDDHNMAENQGANPYERSSAVDESVVRHQRKLPPVWLWIVVAFFVLMIGYVRLNASSGDHALANLLTILLTFLTCNVLGFWFLFLSGFPWRVRLATLAGVLGCLVLFFAVFRIEAVSGEMIPTFRPRWSPKPDQLLERPAGEVAAAGADLSTTTTNDFPQFLGPHRDASLEQVSVAADWSNQPPEQIWRQPIGAGWSGFVAVNGFAVTLEQRGPEELVTCYRVDTGELVWAHAQTTRHATVLGGIGPRSTPTIHEGKVYALGATGRLLCLDGTTGAVIWQDNLLKRYGVSTDEDLLAVAWGRSNSPLIVDDVLVVPVGGPKDGPKRSLAAFHKLTGALVWEGGDRQVSYASPRLAVMAGQRQIVSVNENNVSGHDPADGHELWQYPWPGNSSQNASASQPVILANDRILLTKGYGGGALLLQLTEEASGAISVAEVWSNRQVLKTKFTNVTIHDGHAYGLSDGILECVDLETGDRKWKRGRFGQGQVLGVGDDLLIQAESGDVALVAASPESFQELSSCSAIAGKTWNNLCLYGEFLLVRNAEEAACYRVRLE